MNRISLTDQLRKLQEKIAAEFSQDLTGERISESFNNWKNEYRSLSKDIKGYLSYIRDLEDAIKEDEAEIRLMERQVREGMQSSLRTKEALKKRKYAVLLTSEVIPRYKGEIAYRKREIEITELILAGHSRSEAIKMTIVEEELEPTLF
ncbi:hypothetical protein [Paenibacillus solani]|uniref:hypothetical protein n=1 Tax=Paenibacillus solani TaxID=1705565 RepID=UPI003D296D07